MDTQVTGPSKVSQIHEELRRQENIAECLIKKITLLEERLSVVLLQSFPTPEVGLGERKNIEPRQERVSLALEIEAITNKLQSLNRQIDSINERLEL